MIAEKGPKTFFHPFSTANPHRKKSEMVFQLLRTEWKRRDLHGIDGDDNGLDPKTKRQPLD